MAKLRIIKDFDKLDKNIQEAIFEKYPRGFTRHLIKFQNKEGRYVSALPFETEDKYYLVRMTVSEAKQILEDLINDDDDDDGYISDEIDENFDKMD